MKRSENANNNKKSRLNGVPFAQPSRNPYLLDEKPAELRKSVFVFMDLLGYKEMIEAARTHRQRNRFLRRLHEALRNGRTWLEEEDQLEPLPPKDTFALKAFTDNIVLGWPVYSDAESEFAQAFFKAMHFQLDMVNSGFFVRGAVSVGDVFVDEIAVFGSAVNEAYVAESQLARDPRIVLTTSAVDTVKQHLEYYATRDDCPYMQELLCDSDGQWFLNYLDCVLTPLFDDGDPCYSDLLRHKRIVEERLNQFRNRPAIWSDFDTPAWPTCDAQIWPTTFR